MQRSTKVYKARARILEREIVKGKIKELSKMLGGPIAVSKIVGVSEKTIYRWISGDAIPRGLSLHKLRELGLDL